MPFATRVRAAYRRARFLLLRCAAVLAMVFLAPPLLLFTLCCLSALYTYWIFHAITSSRRTLFRYCEQCPDRERSQPEPSPESAEVASEPAHINPENCGGHV